MAEAGPSRQFRVALLQMCSGRDVERNVSDATDLIRRAKREGADYVPTPEMTTIVELERPRLLAAARPEVGNPALSHFQSLARELGIYLHIGSMAVLVSDGRLANRSFLITPNGDIAARYDKIHMFDVDLGGGESYRESANYQP